MKHKSTIQFELRKTAAHGLGFLVHVRDTKSRDKDVGFYVWAVGGSDWENIDCEREHRNYEEK